MQPAMEALKSPSNTSKKPPRQQRKAISKGDKAFGRISLLDLDENAISRWSFHQIRGDLRDLKRFQQRQQIAASETSPRGELRNAVVDASSSVHSSGGASGAVGLRCNTCEITTFSSLQEQHEHFKSHWHVTNLKRKAKGTKVFSRQESDEYDRQRDAQKRKHKLKNLRLDDAAGDSASSAGHTSSSDDNSSSLSSSSSSQESDSSPSPVGGEPVIEFIDGTSVFKIYKDIMPRLQQENFNPYESLNILRSSKFRWAVFLLRSGRFAGAIFDKDKAICHKTFQRYTTRRKQGGNQSKNDKTNGKARSAGAQIRRYNEAALKQDIANLLNEWKELLRDVEMIFLSSGESDRSYFFGDKKVVLQPTDSRLRRIPFVTSRPTFEEACRVRSELCSIRFAPIESECSKLKSPSKAAAGASKTPPKETEIQAEPATAQAPKNEEEEVQEEIIPALIEAVRANDLTRVKKLVATGEVDDIDVVDKEFMTALHHAAQQNATAMIQFLLTNDANPSLWDLRRRPAFFLCETKESRNVFRRFRGEFPDKWDYNMAQISEPITEDSEAKRKQKEQEKRKRQKAKKKLLKQQQQEQEQIRKQQEEIEKERRRKEEACDFCGQPTGKSPFERLEFKYCSTDCVTKHRRQLMSEAAMKRIGY